MLKYPVYSPYHGPYHRKAGGIVIHCILTNSHRVERGLYMNAEIGSIIFIHSFISDNLLLSTTTTYTTDTARLTTLHYPPLQYLAIHHVDDHPRLLEIDPYRHHQSHGRAPDVFLVIKNPDSINLRNGSLPRGVNGEYSRILYPPVLFPQNIIDIRMNKCPLSIDNTLRFTP